MNATRPGTADHADDRMHRSFGSFFHHRHFSRGNAHSANSGHGHGLTACGQHAAIAVFDAVQIGRGTMPAKTVHDRRFTTVARADGCAIRAEKDSTFVLFMFYSWTWWIILQAGACRP